MPAGRSSHAAVCLQYGDQPQLLISGGIGEQDEFLEDAWVLDVATKSWTQVCGLIMYGISIRALIPLITDTELETIIVMLHAYSKTG